MTVRSMQKLQGPFGATVEFKDTDGVGSVEVDGTALTLLTGNATSAEVDRVADASTRIVDLDATSLSVTAALHGERIITLSHTAAASTVTLPAATGSGNIYTFIVAAVNANNHVIQVANGTDVFEGAAITLQDAGDTVVGFETAADSDTITLNGTTTGGAAIGDKIIIIDYAAGKFQVEARLTGTGAEATPFSAAVA